MEGYLVLQTYKIGDTCVVQIVDWEAHEFPVMEALLRAAVRLCKFMCLSISHSLFDQEMLDLLGRLGFEKTEFGSRIADFRPMILVKSLSYYGIFI